MKKYIYVPESICTEIFHFPYFFCHFTKLLQNKYHPGFVNAYVDLIYNNRELLGGNSHFPIHPSFQLQIIANFFAISCPPTVLCVFLYCLPAGFNFDFMLSIFCASMNAKNQINFIEWTLSILRCSG